MKASILVFLLGIVLMLGGAAGNKSTSAWTEERTRAILVIDAYEHYDEYGNRSLKGVALDKKLQHEFIVALSSQQFQQFQATRQPLDNLEVKTSLSRMKYPGSPEGKIILSGMGCIFGFVFTVGSVIAFFVSLRSHLKAKERRRTEKDWYRQARK